MSEVGHWLVGIWNAIVIAFPVVFHAACEIANNSANALTIK